MDTGTNTSLAIVVSCTSTPSYTNGFTIRARVAIRANTGVGLIRLRLLNGNYAIFGSVTTDYRDNTSISLVRFFLNSNGACSNYRTHLRNSRDEFRTRVKCFNGRGRTFSVGCGTIRLNGHAHDVVGTNKILSSKTRGVFENAVSFGQNSTNSGNSRGRSILLLNSSIMGGAVPLVLYTRRSIRNGRNTDVNELSRTLLFCLTSEKLATRRTRTLVTHTGLSTLYTGVNSTRTRGSIRRCLRTTR